MVIGGERLYNISPKSPRPQKNIYNFFPSSPKYALTARRKKKKKTLKLARVCHSSCWTKKLNENRRPMSRSGSGWK